MVHDVDEFFDGLAIVKGVLAAVVEAFDQLYLGVALFIKIVVQPLIASTYHRPPVGLEVDGFYVKQ